jgi:hypothetical protein
MNAVNRATKSSNSNRNINGITKNVDHMMILKINFIK